VAQCSPLEWHRPCRSPLSDKPRLQKLRALLWFAVRMVVSTQHPVTDGTTASAAMECVEATHTIAATAVGNLLKGGFGSPFFTGRGKSAGASGALTVSRPDAPKADLAATA
jgi:hypothetical protein